MVRINKYLSSCGLGSRRKTEHLISSGRIAVNGKKIFNLAVRVDPECDLVTMDSLPVKPLHVQYYLMLNKPKGYLTTLQDERQRATVMDIIPEKYKRAGIFPVGRLDKDTEGLLLLTNDGDLANKLSRPENKVDKVYRVELDRPLSGKDKAKIEKGMYIHQIGIKTKAASIEYLDKTQRVVSIRIREGNSLWPLEP